jgi:hypothetical protein
MPTSGIKYGRRIWECNNFNGSQITAEKILRSTAGSNDKTQAGWILVMQEYPLTIPHQLTCIIAVTF